MTRCTQSRAPNEGTPLQPNRGLNGATVNISVKLKKHIGPVQGVSWAA